MKLDICGKAANSWMVGAAMLVRAAAALGSAAIAGAALTPVQDRAAIKAVIETRRISVITPLSRWFKSARLFIWTY